MISSAEFLSCLQALWLFTQFFFITIFVATLLVLLSYHAYLFLSICVYGYEDLTLDAETDPSPPSWQRILALRPERQETDDVEAVGERVKYEYESVVDREDPRGYGTV